MKREDLANGKQCPDEEKKDEDVDIPSEVGFKPGDVTWIKLRGSLWWPAQVVDQNAVSGSFKPRKGRSGEILVRLYGTYEYSYVDPVRIHLEFENVLKRHKGSHMEIIQKALKQDFSDSQSGRSKKSAKAKDGNTQHNKTESGSVIKEKVVPAKRATEEQDKDLTSQNSGVSARRLKVMQVLGLTAPSGSPFLKNGQILSLVQ